MYSHLVDYFPEYDGKSALFSQPSRCFPYQHQQTHYSAPLLPFPPEVCVWHD